MKKNLKQTLIKEVEEKRDLANFLIMDELMTKPIKREMFNFLISKVKDNVYCIALFRKNFLRNRMKFTLGNVNDLMCITDEAFENYLNLKTKTYWVKFRDKYYSDFKEHFKKINITKTEKTPTLKQQKEFIDKLNPENKYERLEFV